MVFITHCPNFTFKTGMLFTCPIRFQAIIDSRTAVILEASELPDIQMDGYSNKYPPNTG